MERAAPLTGRRARPGSRHTVDRTWENGRAVKRETAAIRQRVNVAELAQAKDGMARWGRFQAFGRILASTENFHCPCFALRIVNDKGRYHSLAVWQIILRQIIIGWRMRVKDLAKFETEYDTSHEDSALQTRGLFIVKIPFPFARQIDPRRIRRRASRPELL